MSPYWAFGFPSAIIAVVGGDFVYASGTIFIAKVALPHEQSVAGALFQTMTQVTNSGSYFLSQPIIYFQIGTSFGLTVSTIVFDKVVSRDSRPPDHRPGDSVTMGPPPPPPPPLDQLNGYKAAQWTAFSFTIFGMCAHTAFESPTHSNLQPLFLQCYF